MKYIHYGNTEFRQDLFRKIENYYTKPKGGFWASPINAELGWKEWNDETHLRECTKDSSFTFSLKPNAKVVQLHNKGDLYKLPILKDASYETDMVYIDFEKSVEQGIDAIELCTLCFGLYWALYGWDCESILILNKDIIEVE